MAVLNDGARPEIPRWCPPEFASLIKVTECFPGNIGRVSPCERFLAHGVFQYVAWKDDSRSTPVARCIISASWKKRSVALHDVRLLFFEVMHGHRSVHMNQNSSVLLVDVSRMILYRLII